VRRKILKCKDLVLTASVQDEFHHRGVGGWDLWLADLTGIADFAAFIIISVRFE
jgi:hypothetical protein